MKIICPDNYSTQFPVTEIVQAFKYQMEEACNLDEYIVVFGHKALSYYKYRSQILKGILHQRTI